jgi:two-component system cell cycle response regulator CtrA
MEPTQAKIERLETENRWLKELLIARTEFMPAEWGLSVMGRVIMGALLSNKNTVTLEHLVELIYMFNEEPSDARSSIHVTICKMRKKLKPFGISIITDWGTGFHLSPTGKAIILQSLQNG